MIAKKAVWIALLGLVICANAHARLVVVSSQDSALYEGFQRGLESALQHIPQRQVSYLLADEFRAGAIARDPGMVVVAAGVEAAKQLAKVEWHGGVVIYTMLPRSSYDWLRDNDMLVKPHKVVLLDQPAYRFVNLVEVALPDVKSLGYLYGEVSVEQRPELAEAAERNRIKLQATALQNGRRLVNTLRKVVSENDAVLVLPDPYLFNRRTIQALLLTSLRGRTPVISYSESYVKAGALLALSSSPEQLGRQSAEIINCHFEQCPDASGNQYHPKYFSVKLNSTIARQLGVSVAPVEEIQARLEALEPGGKP